MESVLIVGLFDFIVFKVVTLPDVLEQVLNVGILLLAETAMLFEFLVHPLYMHLEVALAQAAERAVRTAEFLSSVIFSYYNIVLDYHDVLGLLAFFVLNIFHNKS